jgi:hypothetical protein
MQLTRAVGEEPVEEVAEIPVVAVVAAGLEAEEAEAVIVEIALSQNSTPR